LTPRATGHGTGPPGYLDSHGRSLLSTGARLANRLLAPLFACLERVVSPILDGASFRRSPFKSHQ